MRKPQSEIYLLIEVCIYILYTASGATKKKKSQLRFRVTANGRSRLVSIKPFVVYCTAVLLKARKKAAERNKEPK